ncbi:hypothetical protein DRO02_02260 [archaeon]|nr:MAG: hypothetical protein DRO02_02260 [archaeon]
MQIIKFLTRFLLNYRLHTLLSFLSLTCLMMGVLISVNVYYYPKVIQASYQSPLKANCTKFMFTDLVVEGRKLANEIGIPYQSNSVICRVHFASVKLGGTYDAEAVFTSENDIPIKEHGIPTPKAGHVIVSSSLSATYGLKAGDNIRLKFGSYSMNLIIIGVVDDSKFMEILDIDGKPIFSEGRLYMLGNLVDVSDMLVTVKGFKYEVIFLGVTINYDRVKLAFDKYQQNLTAIKVAEDGIVKSYMYAVLLGLSGVGFLLFVSLMTFLIATNNKLSMIHYMSRPIFSLLSVGASPSHIHRVFYVLTVLESLLASILAFIFSNVLLLCLGLEPKLNILWIPVLFLLSAASVFPSSIIAIRKLVDQFTPSLKMKWSQFVKEKIMIELSGGVYKHKVPVKIPAELIEKLVQDLYMELKAKTLIHEEAGGLVGVTLSSLKVNGRKKFVINYTSYYPAAMGTIPLPYIISFSPVNEEYEMLIEVEIPTTVLSRSILPQVIEEITSIRMFIVEWFSEKVCRSIKVVRS